MIVLLTIIHVLVCMALIGIVLLQQGKGADMGAAFGGSSQTLFGSSGATTFLGKLTAGAAVVFMATSLGLGILHRADNVGSIITDDVAETPAVTQPLQQPVESTPAAPATPAAPEAENKAE